VLAVNIKILKNIKRILAVSKKKNTRERKTQT